MQVNEKQQISAKWFKDLRDMICAEFEKIEEEFCINNSHNNTKELAGKFIRKNWQRTDQDNLDGGYGEMSLMKGQVFEKVGVNFSQVYGNFSEEFRKEIPGASDNPAFFATGISLVAHMQSPLVPAVHMNTRFICTQKTWFGGGCDLNPAIEDLQDTADFHNAFKKTCDQTDLSYYPKFKKWCDEYFFIKHRNVARGVGGIFFDYLNNGDDDQSFIQDFEFTKAVGSTFLEIYPQIVRRNIYKKFSDEQKKIQLKKRGLYAEFNLLYDRGTKFGLLTGGNSEAILMSLPPVAIWE